MNTEDPKVDWSTAEIQAAVDSYLSMLTRELSGQKFNKAYENRVLREGPLATRSKGSVEFRMQNISTVLAAMGHQRITGYKPAKNVGANVERNIREALNTHDALMFDDYGPTADEATLEQRASKLESRLWQGIPKGILKPQCASSEIRSYVRDPEIRAWVRSQAKGICEGCNQMAPFEKNGRPFLEVHHVKHLANNGSDRISNAVALCPNCHSRCHHSNDRDDFTSSLYDRINRLKRES